MSKTLVRPFSIIAILAILFSQAAPISVAAAPPAVPAGAKGKIAVSKFGDIWLVNAAGTQFTQLTSTPTLEWSPSWSPDGSQIAYACLNSGAVCSMNKDGSNQQQLHTGSMIGSVDWNPDADQILYLESGDLRRINSDQTNDIALTSSGGNIQSGRYSPDGSKIVYVESNGIGVMNADGSSPALLPTTIAGDEAPSWSPDGAQIVFRRGSAGAGNIFVMQASDGSGQSSVTSDAQAYEATWSPDGSKFLITRASGLWMADAPSGGNETQVTGTPVRVPAWQPVNEFIVNSPEDDPDETPGDGICETSTPGECTLRAAIQETNALTSIGPLTIEIECGLTITSNLPAFTNTTVEKVVVEGYGYEINGADAYSLIDVAAGAKVYLEEIILAHGLNTNGGGAIQNAGEVHLINTMVKDNTANEGGAISNNGTLVVSNSLFKHNEATAGSGGAIINMGPATISNSTFTENTASFVGGGFANLATGHVDFYHVTMVRNHSGTASDGGGYAGLDSSTATLTNSLFAGNDGFGAGGGPEVSINGSATITSSNHNLFGSSSLDTSQALINFIPNPFPIDITATSDGDLPTPLEGILNTSLTIDWNTHTAFHRLVYGSPAIDAADIAACNSTPVNNLDQRGLTRPVGATCDIGSYETDVNLFVVTNTNDTLSPGTLRQAITNANGALNTPVAADQILFTIASAPPYTISPNTELPAITEALSIDGENKVVLDGTSATGANGLTLDSSSSVIHHLTIKNFDGAGVAVTSGLSNQINMNSIYDNNTLDIDLGDDGVSFNHEDSIAGPNKYRNYPVLNLATSEGGTLRLVGSLESEVSSSFTIEVYKNQACHPTFFGGGEELIGYFTLMTNASGLAQFDETLNISLTEPQGVSLTATGPYGTSEFSYCRAVSTENLNWAQAQSVSSGSSTPQYMTDNFQEKWFKIPVQPGGTVHINLTSQPGSAVSLHTDPHLIYDALIEPEDETALSAQSANVAFLPSGSLPSGSLPSGSLPSGSLPSGSLPSGYLPSGSLPSGSLPSGSLPSGSLPFGSLPSGSLPSGSLPSGSLPSGSLPSGSLPSGSLPSGSLPSGSLPSGSLPSGSLPSGSLAAYAMAARRSLIGISMNPFRTEHTIERNTYDYLGDLYVRVVGPYDLANPFTLDVLVDSGVCNAIAPVPNTLDVIDGGGPSAGTLQSLILTDSDRLTGTAPQVATAMSKLQTLAARPEVEGVVIDLADAQYERVAWANEQADDNLPCPAAKNLVAEEIKNVIDTYWDANSATLEYIVLAGGASVIPYFQVQDVAEIANEKDYIVPVAPQTASEAGLASNLVQGQDGYGSGSEFTQAGFKLPFPDLAVGRLVDKADDIAIAIDAYIATGGVIQPTSSLVTGYDFVGDGAEVIKTELELGTGTDADTLIQPPGEAPDGPNAWSASDLSSLMLANDYDIVALSGHFSAGDLLAADYESQLSALGLGLSSVDLTDALVLTLGCHGGYTIPKDDLLAGASPNPDWAKAILRKGAAGYIAATGYAYGDTELVEYGERLFVLLAQELRADNGQITVGQALVEAKRKYLTATTQLTGVDQKTIVEMTLYGLPMMKVDMPGTRLGDGGSSGSIVTSTTLASTGPGAGFLSSSLVIDLHPDIGTPQTLQLENLSTGLPITTTYYSGTHGVVANPFEPIYPKEIYEVQYPGSVLRGVAFRGGTYDDDPGIIPLTTAPATDTTSAHKSFNSSVFYPTQMWMPNYIDAANGGETLLMVFPLQYRSGNPGSISGIFRKFTQLDLQFFYLPDAWSNANTRGAAVSAAPNILGGSAEEDSGNVIFNVNVTADGSAGVQAVWVLYTGKPGSPYYGEWAPLDLTQDPDDADTWTGSLPLTGDAEDVLFMVQAVGGAGLTTLNTHNGAFYRVAPEIPPPPPAATTLTFDSPPTSGVYAEDVEFTLHLDAGGPVANKLVTLDIGGQQGLATTDSNGDADITLTMQVQPGNYTAQAAFDGDDGYLAATATSGFSVDKDTVNLSIVSTSPIVAAIKNSSNHQLVGKPLVFVIHNSENTFVRSVNSNFLGRARLGNPPLPSGVYTVDVYFSGTIPIGSSNTLDLTDAYYESDSLLDAGTLTSTAPDVDITATKADSTPYTAGTWTNQTVTVHFDCSDSDGVASCPVDQVFSADGTFNAPGTATDTIGNSANVSFGPIRIDKTAPSLAPTISPLPPVYLKTVRTASPGATDSGSGIASQSCGTVVTTTLGNKTVACTATDNAGNVANLNVNYSVIYRFVGFLKPVYNLPQLNRMQAGRGIQVKFSLSGKQGMSIFASGYPRSVKIACSGTIRNISTVAAPTKSSLKYSSGKYTYTWKTNPAWAGTCRQLIVKFKDGQIYRLNFKFLP